MVMAGAGMALLLAGYKGCAVPLTARPRLLVAENEFAEVEQLIAADPTVQAWYADVKQEADRLVEAETSPTVWECGSVQGDCRNYRKAAIQVEDRLYTLALVYRVSGLKEYADRAWTEMEAMAELSDWNPQEFLDVAHVTSGMAVGYDWLYPVLTRDQREIVSAAIRENGLEPAHASYQGEAWWVTGRNNWNLVCNSAITLGALAVRESFPAFTQEILDNAQASIQPALKAFGPNGGWREGVVYWSYGVSFVARYLASLKSALGTDNGLSDTSGLEEAGSFPIYMTGPTGLHFNFADANAEQEGTPEMFWLSYRYDQPVYTWFNRRWGTDGVRSILYYRPNLDEQGPGDVGLPLDKRFRRVDVATMRGSWDDPETLFAGLKAGNSKVPHSHLDLGSFVLDALGQRWAEDLGWDNYGLPGYSDDTSRRWAYYRIRAEGHNTLVINPGAGPDQDPRASANVTRFASSADRAVMVADLTEAYAAGAISVRRGLKLFDGRRHVMVQDEITTTAPAEVWWFMHTRAPTIDTQNSDKEAVLTGQDGNRLWARILSPSSGASFSVMPAEPLPTSPNPHPDRQRSREDFQKLAVQLSDVTTERLAVLFVPLKPEEDPPQALPAVVSLDEW